MRNRTETLNDKGEYDMINISASLKDKIKVYNILKEEMKPKDEKVKNFLLSLNEIFNAMEVNLYDDSISYTTNEENNEFRNDVKIHYTQDSLDLSIRKIQKIDMDKIYSLREKPDKPLVNTYHFDFIDGKICNFNIPSEITDFIINEMNNPEKSFLGNLAKFIINDNIKYTYSRLATLFEHLGAYCYISHENILKWKKYLCENFAQYYLNASYILAEIKTPKVLQNYAQGTHALKAFEKEVDAVIFTNDTDILARTGLDAFTEWKNEIFKIIKDTSMGTCTLESYPYTLVVTNDNAMLYSSEIDDNSIHVIISDEVKDMTAFKKFMLMDFDDFKEKFENKLEVKITAKINKMKQEDNDIDIERD